MEKLVVGSREFSSRLLVGTGKYKDFQETQDAIVASGAEVVTVAIRRTNIGQNKEEPNLLDFLNPEEFIILPFLLAKLGKKLYLNYFITDDPILCKELDDIGCVSIMPLAAPIGSGLGITNPYNIEIILENSNKPVIVDAGVGTASDATIAMELGCDGVLMNTAIAEAKNPILMASAMKKAIESGREAFLAGRMKKRLYASKSSPEDGVIK